MAVVVAAALPVVAWYALMVRSSPTLMAWARQNVCLSDSPGVYAFAIGLPVLLACWRCDNLFHWPRKSLVDLFARVWLLVGALLAYSGQIIVFESRLSLGLQVPLVIIAVQFLQSLLAGETRHRRLRTVVLAGVVATALPSTVLLTVDLCRNFGGWTKTGVVEAAQYIESRAPAGNVFCEADMGLWLPRLTGRCVYVGHWDLTPGYRDKQAKADAFFSPEMSAGERRELLRIADCALVFATREGAATAGLSVSPDYVELYRNADAVVLGVRPAGGSVP